MIHEFDISDERQLDADSKVNIVLDAANIIVGPSWSPERRHLQTIPWGKRSLKFIFGLPYHEKCINPSVKERDRIRSKSVSIPSHWYYTCWRGSRKSRCETIKCWSWRTYRDWLGHKSDISRWKECIASTRIQIGDIYASLVNSILFIAERKAFPASNLTTRQALLADMGQSWRLWHDQKDFAHGDLMRV